ncbi:MAG: 2Fe-2S iron-sulfur cluster-binding protein, partial [Armatimonadota bacterium]
MARISVQFVPDGKTVELESPATLLDAAKLAGIFINAVCGGEGMCGRCKVIVRAGEVRAEPTAHLSREEIRDGYVLACRCYLEGSAVVEIPPESRIEGAPRLTDEDALRFGSTRVLVGKRRPYPHDPLSKKVM